MEDNVLEECVLSPCEDRKAMFLRLAELQPISHVDRLPLNVEEFLFLQAKLHWEPRGH
jgi:hypothetical protein